MRWVWPAVALAFGCTGGSGFTTSPDGARIHYRVEGSGPDTIVVVHGGPGAGMNDVRPDLAPLTRNHTVIWYDQRGGGRSELPADTARLAARLFVEDLDAIRARFRIERMDVVAHSFGAIVVAEYARSHPDRLRRIVFLAATGPSRTQAADFYRSRPPATDTAAARRQLEILQGLMSGSAADPVRACREYEALGKAIAEAAGRFAGTSGSTCDMPADAVRYYYHYTARLGPDAFGAWDYTASLHDVTAPLLVVDGARDTAGIPMERAWTRTLADARLLLVPEAGRAAYAQRPTIVFAAIDTFLAGRWPAGADAVR